MKLQTQFIRFCLVGVLNTAIHYLTFVFLYRVAGVPILLASAIGYLLGVLNSFIINRKWTFEVVGTGARKEFGKFFIVNLLSLGINTLILDLTVKQLNLLPEIAQIIAIAGALVVNFSGNKFWTFSSIKPKT